MSDELPQLVALRLPTGWYVKRNEWYEVHAAKLPDGDYRWTYLNQKLLQLEDQPRGLIIDVGWFPGGGPTGRYQVKVVYENEWASPILQDYAVTVRGAVFLVEDHAKWSHAPVERVIRSLEHVDASVRARAARDLARRRAIEAIIAINESYLREQDPPTREAFREALSSLVEERYRRRTQK